jgi:hypothetical protein
MENISRHSPDFSYFENMIERDFFNTGAHRKIDGQSPQAREYQTAPPSLYG